MRDRSKNPIRVEALREQIARLEQSRPRDVDTPISSGCGPLDRLLGEGGFRPGTLVEWLSAGEGSGAGRLALGAARMACCNEGALVVLDRRREFCPPAAVRLGIEPQRLIVIQADTVQADTEADDRWALDQALRCPGVAAVLAWPAKLDGRTFRRLQLAAEEGGGLGLLIRPAAAREEPSWADVRLLVEPLPAETLPDPKRRLRIHLLRCRGQAGRRSVEVVIDDETHTVHPAARGADPAYRAIAN